MTGDSVEAGLFAIEEKMEIDETIAASKDAKENVAVFVLDVADT